MQGSKLSRTSLRLLAILLLAVLAACGSAPPKPAPGVQHLGEAMQLEQEGKYAAAAQLYESLAASAQDPQRIEYLVSAAEDWLAAGDVQKSSALLGQVSAKGLYPVLLARINILKAGLDLASHEPQLALTHLNFPLTALPDELKAKLLLVRGQVHAALGQLPAAVEDWSERESYLGSNSTAELANHELIWQTLTEEAQAPLNLATLPKGLSPAARGWLELADIARSSWQAPDKFNARLQAWQSAYPQHPASQDVLSDLVSKQLAATRYPAHIALLLPLTGDYQAVADAIRDGLLSAYYGSVADGQAPSVTLYDSGASADSARSAYAKAVADGAAMVVGPLIKEAVAGIASLHSLPVPVLALNYLDPGKSAPAGMYQFGLSPEGEAQQAAERAVAEGYTHGVALVPANDWGARMLNAFATHYSQAGGALFGSGSYVTGTRDPADSITRLLNIDASQKRAQRLATLLNTRLEFEPRRREDVQFIFLAARGDDARYIQPHIRSHALDLPVLATSDVYQPGQAADTDLDGIRFDDMPWALDDTGPVADTRTVVARTWPNNFSFNSRLYALGFDAYRLVPLLYNSHGIASPVQGVTGILSMDADGRVHRRLDWAAFNQGEPELLAPLALPAPLVVAAPAGTP